MARQKTNRVTLSICFDKDLEPKFFERDGYDNSTLINIALREAIDDMVELNPDEESKDHRRWCTSVRLDRDINDWLNENMRPLKAKNQYINQAIRRYLNR